MADIKDLGIFGANKGLEKMRKDADRRKQLVKETEKTVEPSKKAEKHIVSETVKPVNVPKKPTTTPTLKIDTKRVVGAPVRKFDRVYAVKAPIKLSPLLNATSRILVEKYTTDFSRDELLREALDEYIKQNLSQEDKLDLFNSVKFELDLFRNGNAANQTVPECDAAGNVLRTVEELEKETEDLLIQAWGIRNNDHSK